MNLEDSAMDPIDPAILQPPDGAKLTRQQSRTMQLLQKGSKNKPGSMRKSWSLEFFRSPTGLAPPQPSSTDATPNSDLYTLSLAHTTLSQEGKAVNTGATSSLRTSMVVTAMGHRSEPSTPWYDPSLGHVRTVGGRVVNAQGQTVKRVYASGWAAMGARGVLASTMMDAYGVADTILADAFPGEYEKEGDVLGMVEGDRDEEVVMAGEAMSDNSPIEVEQAVQEGTITGFDDWKLVDNEEIRRGEMTQKERERMGWEEARTFLSHARSRSA